jgi:transcriptional regulator with XRE-family HTH domain
MPGRDSEHARGVRRSRILRLRLGEELRISRRGAGLSIREVARRVGVSPQTIIALERGDPGTMTIDLVARVAAVVGLDLAASLYPNGDPVRDRAQLALLARLRARLPEVTPWRTEVPVPIAGDLRSGDAVLGLPEADVLIEAETHLDDVQAVLRRAAAKARDLGARRLVLLVADTKHNRRVTTDHPELRERFPVGTRACLAALRAGQDPGGDALAIL